ncbi:MAG: DNA topoisomerase IV subunit B, partial [Micrococcus sp.]|nr:DNA topoisomerase IV subunit B [Micrococcus sp.]
MPTQAQSEMQRVEHSYEAGDITVLEGLEAVRKRPGMYIGSTAERGLHHLVYEVVDNSVDEALAGHADTIHVTLQKDGGVRVEDNGRGIPVAMHPTENKPTVEVVMTVLHAGGKFGGGGYAVSGGLHGVGISVVNALSERVHVGICRDGYLWDISFKNGGMLDDALQQGEPTNKNGTTLTFYPDPEIFETTVFDFETLRARFQQMAFLNKGLRITLTDERENVTETDITDEIAGETDNETLADAEAELQSEGDDGEAAPAESTVRRVDYMYENGLLDYVTHLNTSKRAELIHEDVIAFDRENTDLGMSIEVAMQWTTAYSESVHTYANTINTHEGGTHEEGFRGSLT